MQQVNERFTQGEREQAKTRQEITKVLDYLDDLLQKQCISDNERIVMGHQLDRHDKWTHELADKIGHRLAAKKLRGMPPNRTTMYVPTLCGNC